MDGLSPLFEQVRFGESWRGYDPREVDAYIERVEKASVWARGRIETLTERVETESARADESVDPDPETSAAEEAAKAQELARALASAQDTAHDVIEKAGEQAKQMVAEAEGRVEAMIAGANAEGTRIRHEADEYAASTFADVENLAKEREAAAATAEREQHRSAITELAAERARLQEDLELFERHVAERRQEVESSLSRLVEVVESAEIFRTVQAPLNGHPESVVADTDSGEASGAAEFEVGAGERAELDGDDSLKFDSIKPRDETTDSIACESDDILSLDASAVFDDEIDSLLSVTPIDTPGAALGESIETPHGQPRFVTVEDLVERTAFDDGPKPLVGEDALARSQLFYETELSSAAADRREEEPFLAQLREAASRDNIRTDTDDALSAFFNQDEDQRRSPWFLGGR